MRYAPNGLAEDFERHLGDPEHADTAFSFRNCATLDAEEQLPEAIFTVLNRWGLHRYYVPEQFGGRLRDFEEPLQLMRMVARRDLTVAIAHGKTFLGAVCTWVAADPAQAGALAEKILDGEFVAWGLTEREHGSDLMAAEVTAARSAAGYTVNGQKWLINNATRGRLISLFVRTSGAAGARSFDVLMIDKRDIGGSYRTLPKERTLGIRGADISGIGFDDATVPASSLVGYPGSGLETVLKSLQLTRTLCAALSLGAGDHALRLAVRFGSQRILYGQDLIDLPFARRLLSDAYADQLLAEAVTLVAVRSIQALTPEHALTAAMIKYLVPARTDKMVHTLGKFLGARAFLTDVFADGMFQKVQRDNLIVGLFDGNSIVNLHAIINQFPSMARVGREGYTPHPQVDTLFDLAAPLPHFDRSRLSLVAKAGSSVLGVLPRLAQRFDALTAAQPRLAPTGDLVQLIAAQAASVICRAAAHRPSRLNVPAASFDLAAQSAMCYAAAAAIGLWLHNESQMLDDETQPVWRDANWLNAVLARLLAALGVPCRVDPQAEAAMLSMLLHQTRASRVFSLLPCRLAEVAPCPH